MKGLCLLTVGGILLISSTLSFGQDQPLASWGVYALVTMGRTTYEGDKIRAVLIYGETGNPEISLESIHVDMGYPRPNQVVWKTKIDLTGETPDPCPIAESYCAIVKDLRWVDDELRYELVAPSTTLHCRVDYVIARAPKTTCEVKKGTSSPLS